MAKTILLADDSVTIRKVVELTFMDEDYEVVAVASGDEALAQLDALNPDTIIADIHMPGAGGYEVCRTAKSKRRDVPVMLLVGTFEQFDEQDVAACGAETFLKKPFDSQELLRMVDELLAAAPEPEPAMPETEASFSFDDEAPPTLVAPPSVMDEAPSTQVQPPADMEEAPAAFELDEPTLADSESDTTPDSGMEFEADSEAEAASFDAPSFEEPSFDEPSFDEPSFELEPAVESEEPVASSFDEPSFEPEPLEEPRGDDAESEDSEAEAAVDEEEEEAAAAAFEPSEGGEMSEEDVDRIARRVVEYLTDDVVRDLAWEILPDLAEVIVKARLRELEGEAE